MEKKSFEDVVAIVECEGLDYAVQHYMSSEDIEDKKLALLWKNAADALNKLSKYLGLEE